MNLWSAKIRCTLQETLCRGGYENVMGYVKAQVNFSDKSPKTQYKFVCTLWLEYNWTDYFVFNKLKLGSQF